MYKSCKQFAFRHKVPFEITPEEICKLENSPCDFCNSLKKNYTYQNVGLHKWKNGYTKNNVFSLCKLCYIMRNGQSKTKFLHNIKCILIRRPVIQMMNFSSNKMYPNFRCAYCHSHQNLSTNKVCPRKGYTFTNVQTLCWTCNRMKSNINERTFFNHIFNLRTQIQ